MVHVNGIASFFGEGGGGIFTALRVNFLSMLAAISLRRSLHRSLGAKSTTIAHNFNDNIQETHLALKSCVEAEVSL